MNASRVLPSMSYYKLRRPSSFFGWHVHDQNPHLRVFIVLNSGIGRGIGTDRRYVAGIGCSGREFFNILGVSADTLWYVSVSEPPNPETNRSIHTVSADMFG